MSEEIKKSEVKTELVLEGVEDYIRKMDLVKAAANETKNELAQLHTIVQELNKYMREFNEIQAQLGEEAERERERKKTEIRIIARNSVMSPREEQWESLISAVNNTKNKHPEVKFSIEIRDPER